MVFPGRKCFVFILHPTRSSCGQLVAVCYCCKIKKKFQVFYTPAVHHLLTPVFHGRWDGMYKQCLGGAWKDLYVTRLVLGCIYNNKFRLTHLQNCHETHICKTYIGVKAFFNITTLVNIVVLTSLISF